MAEIASPADRAQLAADADRAIVGAIAGGALLFAGHRRHGLVGRLAELIGLGVLTTSIAPFAERTLLRLGSRRRLIEISKTIHVDRPVDEVFEFCHDFENFPRVIPSLRSVVDHQDGRSHWQVRTSGGRLLEWDAVVTKYVPHTVIAWHSVAGSAVDTGGTIRLAPADGGTDITLELSYRPCETDFAEAIHALLDLSPARHLEAELARLPLLLRARRERPRAGGIAAASASRAAPTFREPDRPSA